jgi:predicted RNase H-like nuclease (RuvC/YqgF family)
MSEDFKHQSARVKRRRRHKSSVTNINIFALSAGQDPAVAAGEAPAPPAEAQDEDLFGERLVSAEWLERRAKRLENQEQELKQRAFDIERREAELDEREARFEADMYLREDEIEAREQDLRDLEARLGQKESDLGVFVARVQGGLLADAG